MAIAGLRQVSQSPRLESNVNTTIAIFVDPQGTTFGLYRYAP